MYVTARTIQTLPGQRLAFVDAWVSAAAHPLKHQPGFKHIYVLDVPGAADQVTIFYVWEEAWQMQAWLASEAYQRVQARVAALALGEPVTEDYTLFFEQCACSHHFNTDVVEEEDVGSPADSQAS